MSAWSVVRSRYRWSGPKTHRHTLHHTGGRCHGQLATDWGQIATGRMPHPAGTLDIFSLSSIAVFSSDTMRARLIVEKGEAIPPICDLEVCQPVTLGRSRDNTIVLQDEHASRHHAHVVRDEDRW